MKAIKRKTTNDYKVAITGVCVKNVLGSNDIELTPEEALILADELRENAMEIMDEVYNMPIVPQIIKALIDCGKVAKLEYSNISSSDETGLTLYNIKVVFTDGKSRHYKYECKFFENRDMLKMQLEYVKNIPIIFRDKVLPPYVKEYEGMIGYNLMNTVTSKDLKNAASELKEAVRAGKPIVTIDARKEKGVE